MMMIQPKIRGFICTTAHPMGCAKMVNDQIDIARRHPVTQGPARVLVIGASTGYGLASRIMSAFGAHAKTIGVAFERPADDKRTASPGWYNTAAFETAAMREGLYAKSINGDAFSEQIKAEAADLIARDWGQVDLVIYSLAAPRRTDPTTGKTYSSVLKPIGKVFTGKTVDAFQGLVKDVTIAPATEEEIANTVKVMGGEDWQLWIDYLANRNLLANGIKTVAYSYIGPALTHAVYKDGTIGKAKDDLKRTVTALNQLLHPYQGEALISVNKAVVTQASAAIPVVPLYISLLFKVMKEMDLHEGCIEQIVRLFCDDLYAAHPKARDAEGLIRLDDWEMRADIQDKVATLWPKVTSDNVAALTDIAGYCDDFYRLFGFQAQRVDYEVPVDPRVAIPSIS